MASFYENGLTKDTMQRYLDLSNHILNMLVFENTFGIENWIQFLKGIYELMIINE